MTDRPSINYEYYRARARQERTKAFRDLRRGLADYVARAWARVSAALAVRFSRSQNSAEAR